jgi:phage replication O-like protein O
MKNSQTEHGYTRIANELLDEIIKFDFSKRECKVLFAIIRKTYGYNKIEDDLGLSQLAIMTGIKKPHISTTISDLVNINVIYRNEGKFAHLLGINQNYSEWGGRGYQNSNPTVTKTVTPTSYQNSNPLPPQNELRGYQNSNPPVTKTVTTKDNHQKTVYIPPPLQKDFAESEKEKPFFCGGGEIENLGTELENNSDSAERGAAGIEKIAQVKNQKALEMNHQAGASAQHGIDLIYPKELSKQERQAACNLLSQCNGHAQEILDVLSAAIKAGEIRKSPLALLGGMIRRSNSGTFDPTPGLHVAVARKKSADNQRRVEAATVNRCGAIPELQTQPSAAAMPMIEKIRKMQKAKQDEKAQK